MNPGAPALVTSLHRGPSVVSWFASWLERGAPPQSLRSIASLLYERAARDRLRPYVVLPRSTHVIGVGSAVLGGAGKTPVAIALARQLHAAGSRVAFVGHAYLASPKRTTRVSPAHDVRLVGDDALVAARALDPLGISVWVAPSRDDALAAAAQEASHIVVDGLLQTTPTPLNRSVLVLDGAAPFGAGRCPPAGDLRAPVEALIACADELVVVHDSAESAASTCALPRSRPITHAWIEVDGAQDEHGNRLSLPLLQQQRWGLLTLIGRPERVRASLCRRDITPLCHWMGADHRAPGSVSRVSIRNLAARFRLNGWLVTPKCACHLDRCDVGAPVWVLDTSARLDPDPAAVVESPACAPHVYSPSR